MGTLQAHIGGNSPHIFSGHTEILSDFGKGAVPEVVAYVVCTFEPTGFFHLLEPQLTCLHLHGAFAHIQHLCRVGCGFDGIQLDEQGYFLFGPVSSSLSHRLAD